MQRIKVGDMVKVISGDERGSQGTVREIRRGWFIDRFRVRLGKDPNKDYVIIGGVNIIKKHQRAVSQTRTQTGIIEMEAPLHISKVKLVCPKCNQPTHVGFAVAEDGSKSRICRKCDQAID